MPNLDFNVRSNVGDRAYYDERGRTIAVEEVVADIRILEKEFSFLLQETLTEATREGYRTAKREAPEGPKRADGQPRIPDLIYEFLPAFRAGGLGGGGRYESRLVATGHAVFVIQGTQGKIRPLRGNVLVLDRSFRDPPLKVRWVRGQAANPRWWERAEQSINETIRARLQEARAIHGV